jgi:flagellar hook assembly protein FlgD
MIAVELETPGRATLRVYDATGRAIRTLVDRPAAAGRFEVVWDGRVESGARAPAGVYLLTLRVGDMEVHRKVAVLSP